MAVKVKMCLNTAKGNTTERKWIGKAEELEGLSFLSPHYLSTVHFPFPKLLNSNNKLFASFWAINNLMISIQQSDDQTVCFFHTHWDC